MHIRFVQNKNAGELWGMKEGLTNGQKQEWAKLLYLQHSYTIQEIVAKVAVSEAQLRLWIQEGKWDGLKKSLIITKNEQLNTLYELLQAITDRIKTGNADDTKDVDKVLKLTNAIKNLENESAVAQTIDVAKAFIDFLKEDEPDAVPEQTRRFDRYIKQLERKH